MSVLKWKSALVGGIALVSILLAGWSVTRQFRGGGLFAQQAAPDQKPSKEPPPPDNLPPFVVREDGRAGKIQPVVLPWEGARGAGGILDFIDGCRPAGPGVDVIWREDDLYLVKQKGLLKRVWGGGAIEGRFQPGPRVSFDGSSVCFDGKYVWAALSRYHKAPRLIIVDPQSEQAWELGAEHGLPLAKMDPGPDRQARAYFLVSPISPGQACIAAWDGSTHLATVCFDPKTGPKTKVFLEAAASLARGEPANPEALKKTDLNFKPEQIVNFAPPDAQDQATSPWLLISRRLQNPLEIPPLLVDLEKLSVEAVDLPADLRRAIGARYSIVHDGAVYWLKKVPGFKHKLVWARATPPKFEEKWLLSDMAVGRMTMYDDRTCILGRICWLWQPGSPDLERVAVQPPWSSYGYENVGGSSVEPIFDGKKYYIDAVFPSQNYGVLALASPKNTYAPRVFQFGLANDPRLTPDSPTAPSSAVSELAAKLPAGASASPLSLFRANSDERVEAALGQSVEAADDSDSAYPLLAREIVRQAVLIAARDELQWITRDATLRESPPEANEAAAKFLVHTQFSRDGVAQCWLNALDDRGRQSTVWREKLSLREAGTEPFDYMKLAEAAERWSRETFPALLKQGKLTGDKNEQSEDAAVSAAAGEWLNQMTFTAQFAVLRELHHAVRRQGESTELLGALVRAYANLGVLTEFHWTAVHKACKARALLYAQRLAAKDPQSAWALWHRAYAEALVGLHERALADLQAAEERRRAQAAARPQATSEAPSWVAVIDAYCRFDGDKLSAMIDDAEDAQLAGLLRFFQVESMKQSYVVQELTLRLLEKNPECYRLFDAMCESCAIGVLHSVTELAPAVLHQTIRQRLQQLSNLPPDTAELLKQRSLRGVELSELSDSLLATGAQDDAEEFSWTILGGLLQEVEFVQVWRRAFFMRHQWAVPTDEFIAAVKPLAASHRFRTLIDLYANSAGQDARRQAVERLAARLDLAELDFPQFGAFQSALDGSWQTTRAEQYVKAERRPAMHTDDVHRDLLMAIQHARGGAGTPLAERLMQVSPTSPDAVAAWIRSHRKKALEQAPELERRFASHAQVWKVLAVIHGNPEHERALRTYIKLSPDLWAYQSLAAMLKKQKRMDEWKAAIDEFLSQPDAGLAHAQMRVEVANYFIDRDQWKEAEPYAAAAAETWAEWAMRCAINCYRGLGDIEREGLWRSRVAERYPKTSYSLEWYFYCRRNGLDCGQGAIENIDAQLAANNETFADNAANRLATFYVLTDRPKLALRCYQRFTGSGEDASRLNQGCLAAALAAHEIGDRQARDDALRRLVAADTAFDAWKQLAGWLQASLAADAPTATDLDQVRGILASETEQSRRAVLNYFLGRYLALRGQWDQAIEFLQVAASDPKIWFSDFQTLARAALRARGIKPGSQSPSAPPASDAVGDAQPAAD
ncbi:MAG TPA: hypothetical protein VFW87_17360 [Pirellulales bacterium]|nr:hypothetical protein [Pirellulales bacterium]